MKLASRRELDEIVKPLVREDVFNAFTKVDRGLFVPDEFQEHAYINTSLPLEKDSSISQPSLVAEMIDLLDLKGDERVFEIGTGSGYSSAILSFCCKSVETVEINKKLAKTAKDKLKKLSINNVNVHVGDGAEGFPHKAPFEGIIFTAAINELPKTLILQLKDDGRIVYPHEKGFDNQYLIKGIKKGNKIIEEEITPVRFVKLI